MKFMRSPTSESEAFRLYPNYFMLLHLTQGLLLQKHLTRTKIPSLSLWEFNFSNLYSSSPVIFLALILQIWTQNLSLKEISCTPHLNWKLWQKTSLLDSKSSYHTHEPPLHHVNSAGKHFLLDWPVPKLQIFWNTWPLQTLEHWQSNRSTTERMG